MPLQGMTSSKGMSTKRARGPVPPCRLDPCSGLAALFPVGLGGDGAAGLVRPRKSQKLSTSPLLELTVPQAQLSTPSLSVMPEAVSMWVREQGWSLGWESVSLELEASYLIHLPMVMQRLRPFEDSLYLGLICAQGLILSPVTARGMTGSGGSPCPGIDCI